MKPSTRSPAFALLLSFAACSLPWICAAEEYPEGGAPMERAQGDSHAYELDFALQVAGEVTLVTRTRFCRLEGLHLKLAAAPVPGGWSYRMLGLNRAGDRLNYGVGEGPIRHQRYLLLDENPSDELVERLTLRILDKENVFGCGVPDPRVSGSLADDLPDKKVHLNQYLLENPCGGFLFEVDPQGRTQRVENRIDLRVLSSPGGWKAQPRFFELLEHALRCVPSFAGLFVYAAGPGEDVRWEMDCREILEGLARLVREVYGRKMSLVGPHGVPEQKVAYEGRFLPGTKILCARAVADRLEPVEIRVSGFKGAIWIENFRREVCLDVPERRVLKDVFEISFGIERDAKVLPVAGGMNLVRIALVDAAYARGSVSGHAATPETEEIGGDVPAASQR